MEGNGNRHDHCSNCENEEENSYSRDGLSLANDTGAKKKKKKQKKKKDKGSETDSAQDQPVKVTRGSVFPVTGKVWGLKYRTRLD